MPVTDPFREGLARGWKTHDGSQLEGDLTLEADVAIVGSGAGGGTTAEILSAAGYKVLLIEEGPLKTSSDFKLLEDEAYASLYQEGVGRMSKDGAISILQGRAVRGQSELHLPLGVHRQREHQPGQQRCDQSDRLDHQR